MTYEKLGWVLVKDCGVAAPLDGVEKMAYVQGILVGSRDFATYQGAAYTRWLDLRVNSGRTLSIFDPTPFSASLVLGEEYELILAEAIHGSLSAVVNDYTAPFSGQIVDRNWKAHAAFRYVSPYLTLHPWLRLRTSFGDILMSAAALKDLPTTVTTVQWNSSRLDLLAVQKPASRTVGLHRLVAYCRHAGDHTEMRRKEMDQAQIAEILRQHGIETQSLMPLILADNDSTYRLSVGGAAAVALWQTLRAMVDATGFWPILLGGAVEIATYSSDSRDVRERTSEKLIEASLRLDAQTWVQSPMLSLVRTDAPPIRNYELEEALA